MVLPNLIVTTMADTTRLILGGGLGDIRFGQSPQEVLNILGPSDSPPESVQRLLAWPADDFIHQVSLWYDQISTVVEFCRSPSRGVCLVTIETDNHNVTILGHYPYKMTATELGQLLKAAGAPEMKVQDLDHGHQHWYCGRAFSMGVYRNRIQELRLFIPSLAGHKNEYDWSVTQNTIG